MRKFFCIVLTLCLCLPLLSACHGSRRMDPFVMPEVFDETKSYEITFRGTSFFYIPAVICCKVYNRLYDSLIRNYLFFIYVDIHIGFLYHNFSVCIRISDCIYHI